MGVVAKALSAQQKPISPEDIFTIIIQVMDMFGIPAGPAQLAVQ